MKQEWVCDTSKGGMACGYCSECKSRADEKVLDYLERSRLIAKKHNTIWDIADEIEIAKLLQRETNNK